MPVATLTSSALKTLKDYQGTAMNSSIALLTVAVEEILNRTVYYCPCVEPSEIGCFSTSNSANSTMKCTVQLNRLYGISYIGVPALALFFFMAASSPKLWKTWTGCCKKHDEEKRPKQMIFWTLTEIFARSLIAPVTWVCFSLLDGRYYACSVTPLPYDVGVGAVYTSCTKVAQASSPYYSDAYADNRSVSQLFGWVSIAGAVFIGFVAYAISRCIYPLTYYHAKYFDLYRDYEESEFDDEMTIKAQKEAESNIRKFMSKDRGKKLWDRISTVFSFHRNPNNIALYSYLHEFIREEDKKKPLLELTSGEEEETHIADSKV